MKLLIKDKYFKEIKEGKKDIEYRDAHITFINEKTKETLTKKVRDVSIVSRDLIPLHLHYLFDDIFILKFELL